MPLRRHLAMWRSFGRIQCLMLNVACTPVPACWTRFTVAANACPNTVKLASSSVWPCMAKSEKAQVLG